MTKFFDRKKCEARLLSWWMYKMAGLRKCGIPRAIVTASRKHNMYCGSSHVVIFRVQQSVLPGAVTSCTRFNLPAVPCTFVQCNPPPPLDSCITIFCVSAISYLLSPFPDIDKDRREWSQWNEFYRPCTSGSLLFTFHFLIIQFHCIVIIIMCSIIYKILDYYYSKWQGLSQVWARAGPGFRISNTISVATISSYNIERIFYYLLPTFETALPTGCAVLPTMFVL